MDSILTSIKKLLGIAEEYEHFDPDIVMYINSAFSVLTQLGVGPEEGFRIEDASKTWSEFLYDDPRLEFVKTYLPEGETGVRPAVEFGSDGSN